MPISGEDIEKNEQALSNVLSSIDVVTQERDNTEYEVTDLDHYYEFLGGLSRTVQDKKGEKAEVLVIDSTEEEVVVEDLKISIERAARTRILNPRWIEGMFKHDFHDVYEEKYTPPCTPSPSPRPEGSITVASLRSPAHCLLPFNKR